MKEISSIKNYAKSHSVPIMKDGGIDFICEFIKNNKIKRILEIGSAIGYSAIRFADIAEDIFVTTVEIDLDRYIKAVQNINDRNLSGRIKIINGDALKIDIEGEFDLIFIDAAKAQYIKFFEKYKNNLAQNGVIVSDNLSFHGMVEDLSLTHNYSTIKLVRKIKKYVEFLKSNTEFTTEFYNVGDGISISKKSEEIDMEKVFESKIPETKLNVELIAFDLDDTLLTNERKISERTLSAIKKCAEKGIFIVLCSGRAEHGILPFVRSLDIAGTQAGRYIICMNGAEIFDLHKRIAIHEEKLGSGVLKLVHEEVQKRNLGCHVCDADTIYADIDTEWTRLDANMCGLKFKVVENFDEFLEKGHPKLLIPAPEDEVKKLVPFLKEKLKGRAEVLTSKPYFLEVMPYNCGKGQAILWLSDHLGIKRINTMAFGDSFNDESMLEKVEYGVAMKNGQEEIKKIARYVTRFTNDEDGIADFLESFVL